MKKKKSRRLIVRHRKRCRHCTSFFVVKRNIRQKAKVLIYQSIQVSTLIKGYEHWVVTKRKKLRTNAAEKSSSLAVGLGQPKGIRVEPPLLYIERSRFRWLGYLVRQPPGEVFWACPTGGNSGHAGGNVFLGRFGNALGIPGKSWLK